MLSLPDDWEYSLKGLAAISQEEFDGITIEIVLFILSNLSYYIFGAICMESDKKAVAPEILCIICGITGYAYIRDDGVMVVPITELKP